MPGVATVTDALDAVTKAVGNHGKAVAAAREAASAALSSPPPAAPSEQSPAPTGGPDHGPQ